jgi:molybdopterin/thiamine biosynthesis adenylyltransferase
VETFDDAAYERFCGELVNAGFSPVPTTEQGIWTGPLRPSRQPLTDATRMRIHFDRGWPLQYARVVVDGLRTEHATNGTICLWADDDPAQIAAKDPAVLWSRLDEWAETAQRGFRVEDRALDAYLLFEERGKHRAELPLGDLLRQGGNGFKAPMHATCRGPRAVFLERGQQPDKDVDKPVLRGAFYLRKDIGAPPRNLDDVRAVLTRRQGLDLKHGLDARTPVEVMKPSGGYDFIVLAWPHHDREHDAVVIAFADNGDSLKSYAIPATPNDIDARKRRAGPDSDTLSDKTVLVAGAGSVGGQVALGLATSGVGTIRLHDDDYLTTANLVRHVCPAHFVGYSKTIGVALVIEDHAPWTKIDQGDDLPHQPSTLAELIDGMDLVVDCTGVFSISAALAEVCRRHDAPLITGALFHQGALARIQRQTDGDTPIAARHSDSAYLNLPPEDPTEPTSGFLELGCTAPVNNAPPLAVVSIAADIASAAVDFLTGRRDRPDERILVFRPMDPPFDHTGNIDRPIDASSDVDEPGDGASDTPTGPT